MNALMATGPIQQRQNVLFKPENDAALKDDKENMREETSPSIFRLLTSAEQNIYLKFICRLYLPQQVNCITFSKDEGV